MEPHLDFLLARSEIIRSRVSCIVCLVAGQPLAYETRLSYVNMIGSALQQGKGFGFVFLVRVKQQFKTPEIATNGINLRYYDVGLDYNLFPRFQFSCRLHRSTILC